MKGLRRLLHELGWHVTLLYALHRLLQSVRGGRCRVVPYRFYAQPIGRPVASLRPDTATWIGEFSAAGHPLVPALPRPPAVIGTRFASGGTCHAATVKGRFAGTIWTARGHYDEDEVRCRYRLAAPALSAWDYDVYVDPAFRLGRTMARLWHHVDAWLAADGVRWSFSRISMFNPASVASHARLGARPVGWAVFICLGSLQLGLASTRPHLHLGVRNGPCYDLHPPPGAAPA